MAKVVQVLLKCWNLMQYITKESENFEEGPLVYAPDVLDGNDEQSLVNWFGSWTMLHIQKFRNFLVLGSSYQTEARLSRVIQPVQLVTCCTEHLSHQDSPTTPTSQELPSRVDKVIPEVSLVMKVEEFLTHIDRSNEDLGFSPLVLYRSPVTYWGQGTSSQSEDCYSYFKSYDDWFDYFKGPFFSRAMDLSSMDMLPHYKNTYLGLFHTREEKPGSPCSPSSKGHVQIARPWIAIYRPAEIHNKPWKRMELLIWDPYLRYSKSRSSEVYQGELLVAQEELVRYIMDRSQDSEITLPLERVWVGPFADYQDDGFVDPFDCVLSWIKNISGLVKQRLPLSGNQLPSRGWKRVSLEVSFMRAAGSNVLGMISETQSARKQSLPLRTVFPAPKPITGAITSSKCNNRLQEAMLRYQDANDIPFTFQPTLKWYGEQVMAGRGLQHIEVTDWQTFFARHKIHNPED
ncbi:uncharacterized protein MAM_04195 [Metarhizium album ARSEF 1941]|uniref:Uncharacterized protein n=1 Tax=Metarhizium album (strain ARSEF 1941) TaxID=1081103 RepID=A0A0B2WP42_METAS|nr:uncharacterized protein MAM_04195 [Metarhizium album ARSEF 1941]KHN97806.1 hypothetical protein MAM_04195 [Metarhizium album ARSEF 1941]